VRPNTLVTKILELAREDPKVLDQLERFRRSITLMFTDIKGSTEYFERFGDIAGFAMVHQCNGVLRVAIEQHGGRVIKTIGDAVMAAFDECNASIQAAISIQRQLRDINAIRKKGDEILVRIGLHYGVGIVKSDDVFGDVVNVASRVESIALPEQIIISDSLEKQVSQSNFSLVFLGRFRLKGKTEDRDLFRVQWNDRESEAVDPVHTIVSRPGIDTAKLQELDRKGAVAAEYSLTAEGVTVDGTDANATFANATNIRALPTRFSFAEGQAYVEDINKRGGIFIRLAGTYILNEGDIVAMGAHFFKFVCKPDIVSAATTLGKTVMNVSDLLKEPVVQFVSVNPDGSEPQENYPLQQEEVTFGRTSATYTFEDDPLMSRSHARVYHRGEDFFVEDLTSRNGTFVMVRGKAPVPFDTPVLVGGRSFRVVQ
jgi:class 3 adenylate cyclase